MNDKKIKTQITPQNKQWEEICNCCGYCCLLKYIDIYNAKVFLTTIHCSLLDPKTHKCTNYHKRHSACPSCGNLNLKTLKTEMLVPSFCSYVKQFYKDNNHQPPQINWDETISEKVLENLHPQERLEILRSHVISGSDIFFNYSPEATELLKKQLAQLLNNLLNNKQL